MLIDYLEDAAGELAVLEEKQALLGKEYQVMRDAETRERLAQAKKDIKKKRFEVLEYLYENLQELGLLQKHFPLYVTSLLDDPHLSEILKRVTWLLDFKKMDSPTCQKELLRIKSLRRQLYEARDFLRQWSGSIDRRSLEATWPVLLGLLEDRMDKDEVLMVIKRKNRELRKEGWLIILHEPFIEPVINKFLERIKELRAEALEKRQELKKSTKGIYNQEVLLKEAARTEHEERRLLRRLRHMLLASYSYLLTLKKQKRTWRDTSSMNVLFSSILQKISIAEINERVWLAKIKKRLRDSKAV